MSEYTDLLNKARNIIADLDDSLAKEKVTV